MPDEQPTDDETEVGAHASTADGNDDQIEDDEDEFEAHINKFPSVRMD